MMRGMLMSMLGGCGRIRVSANKKQKFAGSSKANSAGERRRGLDEGKTQARLGLVVSSIRRRQG